MDRRTFLALAATTPVVATVAVRASRVGAAPAEPTNYIGYTAIGTASADELDALTGRPARSVRVFHRQGAAVPTTAAQANVLTHLQVGRKVVLSLKVPDGTAATRGRVAALAADIAGRGYAADVSVILWHEPYPELTAAQFIDRYGALAPAVRDAGLACGVCFHMYPVWHRDLDYTTYWPGDALTDFLAIDTYVSDAPASDGFAADPLATIAPLTSFAKSRGKPFGIAEFAVNRNAAAADPAGAVAWVQKFTRLGRSCQFVLYFNHGEGGLENNDGLLVPAYQALYDRFTPAG